MAVTGYERMNAALAEATHLDWDEQEQGLVQMFALVSIAESLKAIADTLPWEVKRVGNVVVGRTRVDD